MQPAQIVLIVVVLVPLIFVFTNRLRLDLAALSMAAALGLGQLFGLGLLGPPGSQADAIKSIAGFSEPVVIILVGLFIITRGWDKSGVTNWLAGMILRVGEKKETRLITLFAAVTAFLSLFMNNLAAGALILPSALVASRRAGIRPSKLLIPVAYGSLLGGTATYFTSANIIMSDLLRNASPPQPPLNFLDFLPTGGLIAIGGILFLGLFGNRLLPNREPASRQLFGTYTGTELEELYQLPERLWSATLKKDSPLIGLTLAETEIGLRWGVTVAVLQRGREHYILPAASQVILDGDELLLVGREEKIKGLKNLGLKVTPAKENGHLSPHGITFAEAILSPHSSFVGKTLKEISFRQIFRLNVVALKRLHRSYRTDVGDIPLQLGDSLLVIGSAERIRSLRATSDLITIQTDRSDQPVKGRQALLVTAITLIAVAASIAGLPVYLCVLGGAVLTLLLKIMTMEEAYQSIEWQAVFLIGGMYAVSTAMVQTGLAGLLGKGMIAVVENFGPLGVAGGAYLLTALLTQIIGGQVAALVSGPVTISAAISMGISPHAVAVATAIGCSASFFLPMAHPVNILMIAPANYRFSDYIRPGWPLTIFSFILLLAGLKLFWGL